MDVMDCRDRLSLMSQFNVTETPSFSDLLKLSVTLTMEKMSGGGAGKKLTPYLPFSSLLLLSAVTMTSKSSVGSQRKPARQPRKSRSFTSLLSEVLKT